MIEKDCNYICAYNSEEFDCKKYHCDLYESMMTRKEKNKMMKLIDDAIREYENAIIALKKLKEE